MVQEPDVTALLVEVANGNQAAQEQLVPLVYDQLKRLARRYMRRERADHTLQTTALVHEAYLRLAGRSGLPWRDRSHFFQIAAHVMRQVLVDRARKRHAGKRGGSVLQVSLDKALDIAEAQSADLLALEDALARLQQVDGRQCQVIEMRFFAGMSEEEIAQALGVSERTVNREWRMARAWLYQEVHK